ncbi:hypothetical protein TNCV_3622581 [Trichonephila clavipes]|nr:hypothetical protein TNCV_3622581 [Trichonephila clavipes]
MSRFGGLSEVRPPVFKTPNMFGTHLSTHCSANVGWPQWWPAEQKICRQTKITSEKHLDWGIAGGLVKGTSVGKQEKRQFLVPVLLINGYQEIDTVQNGPIEPLYHVVRLRM